MEKPGRVLLSYYFSLALQLGGILLLLLFIIASVWLNITQNQTIEAMKKDIRAAARENVSQNARIEEIGAENAGLQGDLNALAQDKADLLGNVSSLASRLARLDSRIKLHLDARGKTCDGDAESCLEELVNVTEPKPAEPECSPVEDGLCPQKCAPATDYDCCSANGFRWVSGKGCYSR
jgi:hypothetical protein